MPFILVFVSLAIALFSYLRHTDGRGTTLDGNHEGDVVVISSASHSSGLYTTSADLKNPLLEDSNYSNSNGSRSNASLVVGVRCINALKSSCGEFSNANFKWFVLLQILNILIVTGVNIFYLLIENEIRSLGKKPNDIKIPTIPNFYKNFLPIALSIFKIIWSNTFVVLMIKFGIRCDFPEVLLFHHHVFSTIYMYILVPIVSVLVTDVDCFFYAIRDPNKISEDYNNLSLEVDCTLASCTAQLQENTVSSFISVSWIYSYQCGSSLLIDFVPAVLAKYTIIGILLPILKLLWLSFSPSGCIRNISLSNLILPYTFNSLRDNKLHGNRQIRTYRYLSNSLIDIIMLFTFGILCPFLTFIIVFSITINEFVNHLQVGSYLHDKSLLTNEASLKQVEQSVLVASIYLSNSYSLFLSMWKPMVLTVLLFMTLTMFDFISDVYYNIPGFFAVILFWFVIILVFFSRERFDKIFCLNRNKAETQAGTNRNSIIEMNQSPL